MRHQQPHTSRDSVDADDRGQRDLTISRVLTEEGVLPEIAFTRI